ncbi:MAG: cyclase family protein [Corynebacteriales bacterium]|nr:cyclase family protein [Mycobacteriales bacterium]
MDWRVEFDAEVRFSNGGSLRSEGFRLDIAGADISDAALGELFVEHLGLLMVDTVTVTNKRLLNEPHKGSRGVTFESTSRKLVELSHVVRDGMITYPGLPAPKISDYLTREDSRKKYAPGTEFHMGRITLVSNTGTYLDTPFHRYANGADLADIPVGAVADLEGVVVRLTGSDLRAIDRTAIAAHSVTGRAVLIHTGWDQHWGTEQYFNDHPHLTEHAAEWLVDQRPALVGIDSLNIDGTANGTRPAHTALLAAGIPIVEHLRGLSQLPPHGFRFHAAPVAIAGMGTFPVRAYAVIGG